MSEQTMASEPANQETITLDEHKQKMESAIKARLSKSEQEKARLEQERESLKKEAEDLRNSIEAIKSSSQSTEGQQVNSAPAFTEDDIARIIDQKTKENIENEARQKNLDNVQSVLAKGLQEDKEFDELSRANPDSLQPEHVYEIIHALGEKGLPAIKKALKDPEANKEINAFSVYEPGKLVAWASSHANSIPSKADDYKPLPNIDSGSPVGDDDEIKNLVKNARG